MCYTICECVNTCIREYLNVTICVFVYLCTFGCVCVACVYVCTQVQMCHYFWVYLHVCMQCIDELLEASPTKYVCRGTCVYVDACVCVETCVYVDAWVCVETCVHVTFPHLSKWICDGDVHMLIRAYWCVYMHKTGIQCIRQLFNHICHALYMHNTRI